MGSLQVETISVEPTVRFLCTGYAETLDGGRWAEVDPIWSPGAPAELCQPGWALVADWCGSYLQEAAPCTDNHDGEDQEASDEIEMEATEQSCIEEDLSTMASIAASAAHEYALSQ